MLRDHCREMGRVAIPELRIEDSIGVIVVPDSPFDHHQNSQLIGHIVVGRGPGLSVCAKRDTPHLLHLQPGVADRGPIHVVLGRPPGSGQQIDAHTIKKELVAFHPKLAKTKPRTQFVTALQSTLQRQQVRVDVRPQRRVDPGLS